MLVGGLLRGQSGRRLPGRRLLGVSPAAAGMQADGSRAVPPRSAYEQRWQVGLRFVEIGMFFRRCFPIEQIRRGHRSGIFRGLFDTGSDRTSGQRLVRNVLRVRSSKHLKLLTFSSVSFSQDFAEYSFNHSIFSEDIFVALKTVAFCFIV